MAPPLGELARRQPCLRGLVRNLPSPPPAGAPPPEGEGFACRMRAFLSLRGAKRRGNPRPLWVRSPSQKWGTDSHGGLWPPRNDRTGNGWADHPDRCLTVGAGSKPARVIFPPEPVVTGRSAPACAPGAGTNNGRENPAPTVLYAYKRKKFPPCLAERVNRPYGSVKR